MRSKILVIGASSRSFAESACRDGMDVFAIDLFCDRDLTAVCQQVARLSRECYPQGFLDAAAKLPAMPWVYGGGLENHPQLIDQLAATRRLVGNTGRQTVVVRDPARLAVYAKRSGCHFPATFWSPAGLACDGSYLLKGLKSAGGLGVMPWREEAMTAGEKDVCWQQYVAGQVMSASLLLGSDKQELLGFCRQLIGHRWGVGRTFQFYGAIEQPVQLIAERVRQRISGLAGLLAEEIGLRGLIGIDFILPRRGDRETPVVLEINPRPTASMELFERRLGHSLVAQHLTACGLPLTASSAQSVQQRAHMAPLVWAKLTLTSHRSVVITAAVDRLLDSGLAVTRVADEGDWSLLADRPVWGSRIERRKPILTVFAAAGSPAVALRRLRTRANLVTNVLHSEHSEKRHRSVPAKESASSIRVV